MVKDKKTNDKNIYTSKIGANAQGQFFIPNKIE